MIVVNLIFNHPIKDIYLLPDEIKEWMNENPDIVHHWHYWKYGNRDTFSVNFVFDSVEKATFFKLIWGGR